MNMEVDRLATLAYTCEGVSRTQQSSPVFREEVYGVFIDGITVTSKLKQRVMDKCGDEQMRQYLSHKHRLSEGKLEGVNWLALEQYLRSLTPTRRASQLKLQHNWIPTKGFLFLQKREPCDKCPLCLSAVETARHVRQCQASSAITFRRARLSALLSALKGINTAPEILDCWRVYISHECAIPVDDSSVGPITAPASLVSILSLARKHQSLLSWEGFLQGRFSIKWSEVQQIHEQFRRQETASHTRRQPWDVLALRLVCEFLSDLWQFRNDEFHGRTLQEETQKKRIEVEMQVQQLFERNPVLLPRYASVRSTPIEARLKQSTIHLQMWLRRIRQQERITILVKEKAQMTGNSLLPYLVPRSEICRRRHVTLEVDVQHQSQAAGMIGRFIRCFLRYRSKVELPFAGIGDPG